MINIRPLCNFMEDIFKFFIFSTIFVLRIFYTASEQAASEATWKEIDIKQTHCRSKISTFI